MALFPVLFWTAAAWAVQPGPVVTGLSPTGGSFYGHPVTITGSGFTGATSVMFGTQAATNIIVVDDNTITVKTPVNPVWQSVVGVFVTTPDGTNVGGPTFAFTQHGLQPGVDTITPATGPAAGGGTVTITGSAFLYASAVQFGGTMGGGGIHTGGGTLSPNFVVIDANTIQAEVPPGTGTVDIFVYGPSEYTNCACGNPLPVYTYIPAPTVTAVSPNGAATHSSSQTVMLTGTGFTGATAVAFGGVTPVSFSVISDTQISVILPIVSTVDLAVDVTVTAPGGTSAVTANGKFYFNPSSPQANAISPDNGPAAGGTVVTLTGTGFAGATAVNFGATPAASFTVNSNTSITATSPPGTGTVSVTVTGPGGTSGGFSFRYGPHQDSINTETIQSQLTTVVANTSGRAITGAIANGIAQGLVGGPTAMIGPGTQSVFLAYAPDAIRADPFLGFDGPARLAEYGDQWNVWLDVQGSGIFGSGIGQQLNITGGLGYLFSDDLVAGFVGGQEWFSYSSTAPAGVLSGSGTSLGAYAGWRFSNEGMFDAALVWTGLGYNVTSGSASGRFDATRWLLTSGLTGDFALTEDLTVSPSARIYGIWESQQAWVDSLAATHAARSFANGTASAGLTFSGSWELMEDMTIRPYLGLFGDLRYDANAVATMGLEGRIKTGFNLNLSESASFNAGGELGGFGSGRYGWSLSAGVTGGF